MELQFETLGLHVKVLTREVQNEELAARFRLKRERQVRDCEPQARADAHVAVLEHVRIDDDHECSTVGV